MLIDASYPSETFPIILNENSGSSVVNTLIIKPKTGITVNITASSTVILKVNGLDYFTLDGSNNGTNTRDLTLNNTATTGNPVVVWVASKTSKGSNYCTIKNAKIIGASPTLSLGGIVTSGPTFGTAGVVPNDFLTIDNNMVKGVKHGIYILGVNADKDDGLQITNNLIGSTIPLEKIELNGIAVFYVKNFLINKNIIRGVNTSGISAATGIKVSYTAPLSAEVSQNQITDISNSNSGGYGAVGIGINTDYSLLCTNNFVSNVYAYGNVVDAGSNGHGIVVLRGSSGTKIYNNTVTLNTNQIVAGKPSAIFLSTFVGTDIRIQNNILVNSQTQAGEKYAIYSLYNDFYYFNDTNYNDYYSTGPNLGYIRLSNQATLADIRTSFGGNLQSVNISPNFISATDLHLTPANMTLDNLGSPLVEVPKDIDDTTRSSTTPDMGADEFMSSTLAVKTTTKTTVDFYPNPVVDFLQINHSSKIESVEVYSATGEKVAAKTINNKKGIVNMKSLPKGMYFVKIFIGKEVEIIKVLKK